MKGNLIADLTFSFSLQVIQLYKIMTGEREYVLSKQLLRSATSIGANVQEAIAAQSKKDFISKMSIASKEARETRYWLKLIQYSKIINVEIEFSEYLTAIEQIIKIITRIIKTTQSNLELKS